MGASMDSDATFGRTQLLGFYLLAALVVVLDWWTKSLASSLLDYGVPHVITPLFNLTLLHNRGAAFSLLSEAGGWQHWLLGGIALAVSVAIVVALRRLPRAARWQGLGLALVLGGAIGNLGDRLRLGYVVDFIQVHYQELYWPAFNIADSAITVGAALLILDMLRNPARDS
ncbi:MAG: lipoprotein signal peptidase [Gammaproteobacteria bacterium]|nr:lipoprotein signal peptidase [Gammaproteobacteria bacterium]MBK8132144.1 lipoprotein signal peptidase [Gammaproteobacteria bacterium]